MPLLRRSTRVTLRVTAEDPDASVPFDAMLILGGVGIQARALSDERTPFELELPDRDCTAVIRGGDPDVRLTVEYAVERAGQRQLYGRTSLPVAVLERRGSAIVAGGLPAPGARGDAGSGVLAPVV